MPTRLKEKFYRIAIRPTMTYGAECWPIKKQDMHKMDVAESRMLRWMCGKTRKDKIKNECFREHLGVATIGGKIRKTCLRWFGHVQRKSVMVPVRKSFAMKVDGLPSGRSGLKRTWMDVVQIYMKKCNLSEDLAEDRSQRRNEIRIADPNIVETML